MTLFEGNLPQQRQSERERESEKEREREKERKKASEERASSMPNDMVIAGNRAP